MDFEKPIFLIHFSPTVVVMGVAYDFFASKYSFCFKTPFRSLENHPGTLALLAKRFISSSSLDLVNLTLMTATKLSFDLNFSP